MSAEAEFRQLVSVIERGGVRARLAFMERYLFLHRTSPELAKKFFDVVSQRLPERDRESVFDALERLLQE